MSIDPLAAAPRLRLLPRIYQALLTLSRKHGLFTLARLHHRVFRDGQITAIPGGGMLFIPADPHYFGFLSGVHERHVERVIHETVKPGDICIDVGANIGYFAMMMALRAGATGRVIAFEPVPETHAVLAMNARLAAQSCLNLEAVQAAISAEDGDLAICRSEHSTMNQVTGITPECEGADTVPAWSLVNALQRLKCTQPISLLKIDVEGHELAVIRGAVDVLRSGAVNRLVIEITPGDDAVEIEKLLSGLSAVWQCWEDGAWKALPLSQISTRTDVLIDFQHHTPPPV